MAARDVVLIGVIIFMFAIGFFVIYGVTNTTINTMLSIPAINQSASAKAALQGSQGVTQRMDYIIFGLFIGLTLALIITGWFIGGNPIFTMIYFIVVIMAVVFATVLSNVWETTSQASVFGTDVTAFPITNNLMLNLPIYIGIVGFLGLIVMFGKPYFLGGGGSEY